MAKYAKISILSDWKDGIDMAEGKRRFKVQIDDYWEEYPWTHECGNGSC